MSIQAINAQALKPAVSFKAEETKAAAVAEAPADKAENKHTAAKVVGGAAALAILGFGIFKAAKGKGVKGAKISSQWTQIKEGVKEMTAKNGNKYRIYDGKNGDRLVVIKNKDGEMIKMIRRRKIDFAPKTKADDVNLDKKFADALQEAKDKTTPRHLQAPVTEEIKAPTVRTVTGKNEFAASGNERVNINQKPEFITTVTDYVAKDGKVSKKPVMTTVLGKSAEGSYKMTSSPSSHYVNEVTTAKDGTKTLNIMEDTGKELGSIKYKDGNIIEKTDNIYANFNEKGELFFEFVK